MNSPLDGKTIRVQTVLVGFTTSDTSARALARAADLAEAFAARLVVVSVAAVRAAPVATPVAEPGALLVPAPVDVGVPPVDPLQPSVGVPEPDELAQPELDLAREYLGRRRADAEYVSEVGDAADAILAAAERHEADVIVVGAADHGFVERLLGRPVEEAVARHAERDVLLVR